MGQGRFGHDRILSGVIVCHVVGNNGVFPERGSRGPCVGVWGPGSIWQRMWYFCAKFLWIKGVFYHGLCVIIYAGRRAETGRNANPTTQLVQQPLHPDDELPTERWAHEKI